MLFQKGIWDISLDHGNVNWQRIKENQTEEREMDRMTS